MAATWIEKQSEVIKSATKDASKSKESAQKFLRDAGIIKAPAATSGSDKKKG